MANLNLVNRVLIGDGTNTGGVTSLPQMQAGDLFLVDEAGNVITTTAAAVALSKFSKVRVASGIGSGEVILSSPIQGNYVSTFQGKAYTAPVQQVTYVGYNPIALSGSIGADASSDYRLRVLIKDTNWVSGMRQTMSDYHYVSGATGNSQAAAAASVLCQYLQKDYGVNYMYNKVLVERVSDGSQTALAANAAVINGSKTVTIVAHTLSVGNTIRLAGVTYVVAAVVSANVITLDYPYSGATGTITAGTTVATQAGLVATPVNWGFKITGIAQTSRLDKGAASNVDEYEWIVFDASYGKTTDRDFTSIATTTTTTLGLPGIGFWKQVRDREEAAKGYWGDTSKRRFDDFRISTNTVVGTNYVQVQISHEIYVSGDFQGTYREPLQTEIYMPTGSAQATVSGDNFSAILNGFLSTVVGFPTLTFA
jgi:hypothetical protein